MSTKKKISDIDKAIEEMQQRRDECFKHIGKAMYESCPELGDMSVADMRKAGHYHQSDWRNCYGRKNAQPLRGNSFGAAYQSTAATGGIRRDPKPVHDRAHHKIL